MEDRILEITQLEQQIEKQGLKNENRLRNFSTTSSMPTFAFTGYQKEKRPKKKAEIDVFLELSCFFDEPTDVGSLIFGFSAFSKSNLNIQKFMVHVQLKPGLENFEHYFANV